MFREALISMLDWVGKLGWITRLPQAPTYSL